MQQTNGVAVLATQLAHTDHRALSQAWYSALHLADHAPPPPARAHAASNAGMMTRGTMASSGAVERCTGEARDIAQAHAQRRTTQLPSAMPHRAASATVPTSRAGGAHAHGAERRVPTDLARRIERGLALCGPRSGAASFTVNAAEGRVHLVVRSDGARTRVVAVCAPPLRERVERALAHVRFAFGGSDLLAEVA